MTRSEIESGMGHFDPYQNENPPYIVHMHTTQDHAVNLHGRRLNISAVRLRVRTRGIRDAPPYGIGLCPIL